MLVTSRERNRPPRNLRDVLGGRPRIRDLGGPYSRI